MWQKYGFEFKLKGIDETRNYLSDEIKYYDLMSEKHKKVCRDLNYFEHVIVFVSAVSDCVSISALASLVGFPVAIVSSAIRLKVFVTIPGIKKYKSIINRRKYSMMK